MAMFKALYWKEYRENRALCVTFVGMVFLIQLLAFSLFLWDTHGSTAPYYYGIAFFMAAMYSGATAATLFSHEREDKTDNYLRSLPVSGGTVLRAKLGWFLSGLAFVLIGCFLCALLWAHLDPKYLVQQGNAAAGMDEREFMATFLLFVAQLAVWGLFWSVRVDSGLKAVLATYGCFAAEILLIGQLGEFLHDAGVSEKLGIGLITLLLLPFALVGGARWLRRTGRVERGRIAEWFARKTEAVRERIAVALGARKKGTRLENVGPSLLRAPSIMMIRLTLRQSRLVLGTGLLLAAYLTFHVLYFRELLTLTVVSAPIRYGHSSLSPDTLWWIMNLPYQVLFALGVLFGCAGPFRQDRKHDSYRMLSYRGVSPALVWWGRVLPFAIVYLLPLPILFLMVWDQYQATLAHMAGNQLRYYGAFRFYSPEPLALNLGLAFTLYLAPLCIGVFTSRLFRGIVLATGTAFLFFCTLLCFMGVMMAMYGFNPLWTTLPFLLALLLASRWGTRNWLREHGNWKTRLATAVVCLAPLPFILGAVPYLRIYGVPVVDYGFHAETILAERGDTHPPVVDRTWSFYNSVALAYTAYRDTGAGGWPFHGTVNSRSHRDAYRLCHTVPHSYRPLGTERRVRRPVAGTPAFETQRRVLVKQLTALQNAEPRDSTPHIASVYIHWERDVLAGGWPPHGKKWYNANGAYALEEMLFSMPWEHERARRRAEYLFQVRCLLATHMDAAITADEGDVAALERAWIAVFAQTEKGECDSVYGNLFVGNWSDMNGTTPTAIFMNEMRRRVGIIETALRLWQMDHDGALPGSLDALTGPSKNGSPYLKNVPTIPVGGGAFEYIPPKTAEDSSVRKKYPGLATDRTYLRSGGLFWELSNVH